MDDVMQVSDDVIRPYDATHIKQLVAAMSQTRQYDLPVMAFCSLKKSNPLKHFLRLFLTTVLY